MLNAKFFVPVIKNIRADICKFSLSNSRYSSCGTTKSPQRTKRTTDSSKCDKVAQCSKPARKCRKRFFQPKPECKVKNIAEEYRKVNQNVVDHAKSILDDFQTRSKLMLDQLKRNIETSKSVEEKHVDELSHDTKKKVQRLLVLDPSFGSCKRKSTLSLEYQTREALNSLQCDVKPQLKRIQSIADNLERDLLTRLNRAKFLISSCRKCKSPKSLERCVEENEKYATKILDKTSENMKVGLKRIEKTQQEILEHHRASMMQLMRSYREKNKALSEHLDDCIFAAKNKEKN